MAIPTVAEVKANLILEGTDDDALISRYISAAVSYAEAYQHLPDGYYSGGCACEGHEMKPRTAQAVIVLASHYYESRDLGTGGYFGNRSDAAARTMEAVDDLLRLDRDWKV